MRARNPLRNRNQERWIRRPDSGTLHRYTWNPDNDDLDPLAYDYYPPDEAQIE